MKAETDYLVDPDVEGRMKLKWTIDWAIFVRISIKPTDDILGQK